MSVYQYKIGIYFLAKLLEHLAKNKEDVEEKLLGYGKEDFNLLCNRIYKTLATEDKQPIDPIKLKTLQEEFIQKGNCGLHNRGVKKMRRTNS